MTGRVYAITGAFGVLGSAVALFYAGCAFAWQRIGRPHADRPHVRAARILSCIRPDRGTKGAQRRDEGRRANLRLDTHRR